MRYDLAKIMHSLADIIGSGEPLPIAWVVKHSAEFSLAWKFIYENDPELMMRIAAHIFPHKQIVLAAVSYARASLIHMPDSELRPLRAVEATEKWIEGKETTARVLQAASDAYTASAEMEDDRPISANAASVAAHAAWATDHDPTKVDEEAETAAYYYSISADSLSRLVVRIEPTMADLVRAGKNGWQP